MSKLRYVGDGAFIAGIPARDLDDDDVKALPAGVTAALLVKRGLYKAVSAPAKTKAAKPKAAAPMPEAPAPEKE